MSFRWTGLCITLHAGSSGCSFDPGEMGRAFPGLRIESGGTQIEFTRSSEGFSIQRIVVAIGYFGECG
jgi:hypothetical protein